MIVTINGEEALLRRNKEFDVLEAISVHTGNVIWREDTPEEQVGTAIERMVNREKRERAVQQI